METASRKVADDGSESQNKTLAMYSCQNVDHDPSAEIEAADDFIAGLFGGGVNRNRQSIVTEYKITDGGTRTGKHVG